MHFQREVFQALGTSRFPVIALQHHHQIVTTHVKQLILFHIDLCLKHLAQHQNHFVATTVAEVIVVRFEMVKIAISHMKIHVAL